MNKLKYMLLILIVPIIAFFGFNIVKADISIDNGFYIINFNNNDYENDYDLLDDLLNELINFYEIPTNDLIHLTTANYIDTNLNDVEIRINNELYYSEFDLTVTSLEITGYDDYLNEYYFAYNRDMVDIIQNGIGAYYVNFNFLPQLPKDPPFTGLINFIKNFLQDLLKSITDMTMFLINNIWDTNLIDINLVILSDTPIYTGTLNDILYSVFSIFYVMVAIIVVWKILKKLTIGLFRMFNFGRWQT